MSRRTSIIVPRDIGGILDDLGNPQLAPLLWQLLREHHQTVMTGDLWRGTGTFKGWRIVKMTIEGVDRLYLITPMGAKRRLGTE